MTKKVMKKSGVVVSLAFLVVACSVDDLDICIFNRCDWDYVDSEIIEIDADTTSDALPDTGLDTDFRSDSAPVVSNLTVEPNPNNVLSVFVNWTTDQSTDSEVQFGEEAYQFKIYDGEQVTDHRVLVIGMHAQTRYLIKAVSSNNNGTGEAEETFATSVLPANVPEGALIVNEADRSQSGWTLINVLTGSGQNVPRSDYPAAAVMYDQDGRVVWYNQHGIVPDSGGATSMDFLPDSNTILMGPTDSERPREVDMAGNTVWEGPEIMAENYEGFLSHHVGKLSNGNYILLRWTLDFFTVDEDTDSEDTDYEDIDGGDVDGGYTNNDIVVLLGTQVEEVTPQNTQVRKWDLFDFITVPDGAAGDYCHGNSATVNIERNEVYISCRWLGIFKISYHDPELLWHMPASYGASGMGDVTFIPAKSQFSDIHDPEIHDDGTILVFDNGGWDVEAFMNADGDFDFHSSDYHSRVLEFAMDDTTKQATRVWEFPGNFDVDPWYRDEFYLPFWGDADRLDNGNVLVTAGVVGLGLISHVFEVTREDGQVVWDLTLPEDHGVYRAQRISKLPFVERIDNVDPTDD